ncbi:MAG: hypothetical protein SFW36_16925 [Leptolyngbyaceae cyanobacterium bins.59]|nr:hypothetical protein [Leptolyngbyaceae cyanobacterium bins.59]
MNLNLAVGCLIASSFLVLPLSQLKVIAGEVDYPCYMTDKNGKVYNLSPSLCGSSTGRPSNSTITPIAAPVPSRSTLPATRNVSTPSSATPPSGLPQFRTMYGRITTSSFLAGKNFYCGQFKYKAEALSIFNYDPQNDPFDFDPDKDGDVCEGTFDATGLNRSATRSITNR